VGLFEHFRVILVNFRVFFIFSILDIFERIFSQNFHFCGQFEHFWGDFAVILVILIFRGDF